MHKVIIVPVANGIYRWECACGRTGFPSSMRTAVDREGHMHEAGFNAQEAQN